MKTQANRVSPGWFAWTAALAVAASAAALSFAALAELARVSGVPAELAPLLPITIDAGVLVSAKFWLTPGLVERVTRFARTLTLSLIVVSSAGNIAGHVYAATPPEHFWLSAAVSLVAPLTLAAIAHLIVIARVPAQEDAPAAPSPRREHGDVVPAQVLEAPGNPVVADTQPIPVSPLVKVAAAERTASEVRVAVKPTPAAPEPAVAPPARVRDEKTRDTADPRVDQLIAWAREEGGMPSQRKVIERFGVHNKTAKKLVEAAEASRVNGTKVI